MKTNNFFVYMFTILLMPGCDYEKEPDILIDNVLVYINNAAIQCETKGMSTTESAQLLINKGVDVISSYCGFLTGVTIATQCGLGDTQINLHEINSENIPDAQKSGFEPVSSLKLESDKGYQIIACQE